MGILTSLFVLLWSAWCTGTIWHPHRFQVHEDGDTFNITVGGILMFHHSPASPMILVGNGELDIQGEGGHYAIHHRNKDKMALRDFLIFHEQDKDRNDQTFIELSGSDGVRVVMRLTSSEVHGVDATFLVTPRHWPLTYLRVYAEPGEHVYGGGQQFAHFDLRGHDVEIWARGQGTRSDRTSLADYLVERQSPSSRDLHSHSPYPQPTFVSSRDYLCHVHGYNYAKMDFRDTRFHEILIQGDPGGFSCDVRERMDYLMNKLTFYTERPEYMPSWVHEGAILGVNGDTQQILTTLSHARAAGVHVAGVVFETWRGSVDEQTGARTFWNWEWNDSYFPDLKATIASLKQQDIRVLGYVSPHFPPGSQFYNVCREHGYLVKNVTGHVHLQFMEGAQMSTLDITNPSAWDWFKDVLRTAFVDVGLGGWLADGGVAAPVNGVYFSQDPPDVIHNKYPVRWATLNREVIQDAQKLGEVIFFTKSGAASTSKYSLMTWAGEQTVDFGAADGLASVVTAALSVSMTGTGLSHFEIGGYTSYHADEVSHEGLALARSEELLLRSAELAVFTPMMRTTEGRIPSINTQIGSSESILQAFAQLTSLYVQLKPYRLRAERQGRRQGRLLCRPLFVNYEHDPTTYGIRDQFMFGEDLLVAPVLTQGASERQVYLPGDQWRHLFSGKLHSGPAWASVPAPLGQPPVFYRTVSDFSKLFESLGNSSYNTGHCLSGANTCS